MAQLTLLMEDREVRTFPLNKGVTTIGRAQENDIVINNLALSRKHAQVESRGNTYSVVDLGSQNGVFVNGEKVRGKQVLRDQDSVTLGTYQFVFRAEAPEVKPEKKDPPSPRPGPSPAAKKAPARAKSAAKPRVPLLVLKYNDVELQRFPLVSAECVIGRAKECDVQVAERRLSRRHCQIWKGEDGQYFLKDMGSQNGTYVNRRRIRGFYELQHGDIINFAEYAVHYLADMNAYAGPDAQDADASNPPPTMAPAPAISAQVEAEETALPPAYRDSSSPGFRPSGVSMVRPSDLDEDPDDPDHAPVPPMARAPLLGDRGARSARAAVEPIIQPPAEARAHRTARRGVDEVGASKPAEPAPRATLKAAGKNGTAGSTRPRPEAKRGRRRHEAPADAAPEQIDVPDHGIEAKPDAELDGWYSGRDHHSRLHAPMPEAGEPVEEDADGSDLIQRAQSSVSQVLSTMMLDKRELDRNLKRPAPKKRTRRFLVDVRHEDKRIFSGPLENPVTILGRDPDADIKLKGRYVAGRHSLLVRVHDSLLLVRLGSSSAARVNGLPKLQAFLKDGDVVQIDETTIHITEE